MKIVIATSNPGKFAELSEMLDMDIHWKSLSDFEGLSEVIEDGQTFIENARKKAIEYALQTGCWVIADDSGLAIDALDGQPGVKSARFSDTKDSERTLIDHKNIKKVLELMQSVPNEKRTARFICCICLASPEKVLIETQGTLSGTITENEIGENGFGYDPIFWVTEKNKTAAQMTSQEKNAISHRGKAILKLKPLLAELIKKTNSCESRKTPTFPH